MRVAMAPAATQSLFELLLGQRRDHHRHVILTPQLGGQPDVLAQQLEREVDGIERAREHDVRDHLLEHAPLAERAALERIEQCFGLHARLHAECHSLGDGHAGACGDHVVDELGDGAAADLADAHHLVPDGIEHGLDALVERLVTADEHRELARARSGHAAADRGVEHVHAALGVHAMDTADERGRAGGQIDVHGAARGAFEDAARSQRHRLDLARARQ